MGNRWQSVNGIYQIYPRSFRDANHDGVGDLAGIAEKLGYIKGSPGSLGIDAIWISPFYPSPMADFGYDVADYCDVDPLFGNLADFQKLLAAAHQRDIKVMIDYVPNHSSSSHPWFIDSRSSPISSKRDWYIWHDSKSDGSPPNNWLSVFGGSAWEFDESSGQYYMHSFLASQPDLNWSNPEVRKAMTDVLRFWMDMGVDGIRADAVRWMGKTPDFPDDPINDAYQDGQDPYHAVEHKYSRYSHEFDLYLREMTSVMREYDDKIIIFEDHFDTLAPLDSQIKRIYAIDPSVSAPFNFQAMHTHFGSRNFSDMISTYQSYVPEGARSFYCFSNHDETRLASRFGEKQARMLAVLQLSLPGTPVIYNGQEIGMVDGTIEPHQVQDPFEKHVPGKGLGRDPERTPMQWSSNFMAGFSSANESWLPIPESYKEVNVALHQQDEQSSLSVYQRMLAFRAQYEALRDGVYDHGYTDDKVCMFWRHGKIDRFLCIFNFSDELAEVAMPEDGEFLISAQSQPLPLATSSHMLVSPLDGVVIRYII